MKQRQTAFNNMTTAFYPSAAPIAFPKTMSTQTKIPDSNQFGFRLPLNLAREFRESLVKENGDIAAYSPILEELVRGYLAGQYKPNAIARDGFNTFSAPYLSAVPCGPWQEAIDRAERFTISTETADELEAQDGDVWVRADGQSMEGAGIMDGVLVLVRPYDRKTPRRGEIVLIQVVLEDDDYLSTLKRFDGYDGQVPKLLDGEDNAFDLPEGSTSPQIIGRAIGTLGRL